MLRCFSFSLFALILVMLVQIMVIVFSINIFFRLDIMWASALRYFCITALFVKKVGYCSSNQKACSLVWHHSAKIARKCALVFLSVVDVCREMIENENTLPNVYRGNLKSFILNFFLLQRLLPKGVSLYGKAWCTIIYPWTSKSPSLLVHEKSSWSIPLKKNFNQIQKHALKMFVSWTDDLLAPNFLDAFLLKPGNINPASFKKKKKTLI